MAKTWFITGTSSGFGQALAKIIAQHEDVNLIAAARNLADLAYLNDYDQTAIEKVVMDVTNKDQIAEAVKQGQARFGGIDVLVNNAGLGYFGTVEESNEADVRQLFDVNVFGLANVTKAVLPVMRQQKSGLIINVSSVLGITSLPTFGWYSATKFAVEGVPNVLRQEVKGLGIKVMLVEPSGARTKWNAGKTAPVEINDYQQFAEMISGAASGTTQAPGDPVRIAQLMFDVATADEPVPGHLPLGEFATNGMKQELSTSLAEVEQYHELSLKADAPA
ncbi:SDR family NAD(P)-dependent oxidoreductase [Secundilactobacillus paracollinoides]|uniref:Short-chain dehydrogenase/reductase n=1 Tax=Secundilactobacillus paracollinoides TaxID=240427 RepID=A0A1B2J0R5_9LACO|nr:SDR family NAD(P)-dependent oxidoreductase [Secundilactobacillus paracollinoides]ANZ61919.1 short-chain dehydrogenase/reductase [Secundilactobacillus paracollinoides]ANZ67840.1 short-chain dehydrogenase/reductase [Secundilactobacillus paracollinoides]